MLLSNIPLLLSNHGISPTLGFLSPDESLSAFANTYYAAWDVLAAQLPELLKSGQLANEISLLPVLNTSQLHSELEWRRAYVLLGFLVHAYVWGSSASAPTESIPPQLAEPFIQACKHLGVEPALSYSGLVLWNWSFSKPCTFDGPLPDLQHLASLVSFTGSRGEDAFYHVPVLVEAEGGHLIPLLLGAIEAAQQGDFASVRDALHTSAATFVKMGRHLPKLFETLDPHMFYHQLRPLLAGGKGMETKGLERGMVFQKSDGTEVEVRCIGGSAAQSSLFPFLDHVLGVVHQESGSSQSVFKEMRAYMPNKHREFLNIVASLPSLRSFIERCTGQTELYSAFDECLKQLRLWRGKHIAVVSKYIVQPARADTKTQAREGQDLSSDFESVAGEELQGTAGSALIPFLRQARDETAGLSLVDE